MNKIYVVTNGSYSDFRIKAVFDNLEMAEAYQKTYNYNEEIEEFELNPTDEIIKSGLHYFSIIMDVTGNKPDCYCNFIMGEHGKSYVNNLEIRDEYSDIPIVLCAYVVAKDEDAAIKIVNEHRAYLIVNNLFIPGKHFKIEGKEYKEL